MAIPSTIQNLVTMYPSLAEGHEADYATMEYSAQNELRRTILNTVRRRFAERPLTKRSIIAQAIYATDRNAAYYWALGHLQTHPALTFTRHAKPGEYGSQRLDMPTAKQRLRYLVNDMAGIVARIKAAEAEGGSTPEATPAPTPDPVPEAPKPSNPASDLKAWLDRFRNFCDHRDADGQPIDTVGMRPYENGARMLKAGIPVEAIKQALTMHLPVEARRGIDVHTIRPVSNKYAYDVTSYGEAEDGKHPALAYCHTLAQAGVPLALVGPKGTGKSTLARQLAEKIFGDSAVEDGKFGMVSMTNGTSPSAFYGRPQIGGDGGVIESLFVKCYREGGVFLFDEMDAANENLLLIVNAALANGHFANPQTGEIVSRHPDFIPVAAMNTLGIGADRHYTGRNKLDAAALDRWAAGRTPIEFDEALAHRIFDSIAGE